MCKDAFGCSPQAVVWDSGVINELNVSLICYAGSQLKPRTRYDWILTLWDMHGNCVDSAVCWFETGKCREAWTAKWISAPGIRLDRNDAPALYLRRKFGLGAAVKSARMYIADWVYTRHLLTMRRSVIRFWSPHTQSTMYLHSTAYMISRLF